MEEDKDLALETPEVAVGETTTRVEETLSWLSRGQRKIQEWQFKRKMSYPFIGNINQSSDVLEAAMPLDPEHQVEAAHRYSLTSKDDPRMMEFLLSDGVCDEAKWILLCTIRPTSFYSSDSCGLVLGAMPRVLEGLCQSNSQEWIFVLSDLRIIEFLSSRYVPTEAKQEMMELIRDGVSQSSTDPIQTNEDMNRLLEHWEQASDLSFEYLARLHPDFDQWNESVVPFLQNPEVPENVRVSFLHNCRIRTEEFRILNREFVYNRSSSEFWEQLKRAHLSEYRLEKIIQILGLDGISPANFWEEAPKLNISKEIRYKVYCEVCSFDLDGVETEDFWNHVVALDLPDEITLRIVEMVEDDSLKTTSQQWTEGGWMRSIILDSSISIAIRRALIPKLRHYEVTWEFVGDIVMDHSFDLGIRYELGKKVNRVNMVRDYGPTLTQATGLIPLRDLPEDPNSRWASHDYQSFTCRAAQILDGNLDQDAYDNLEDIHLLDDNSWERLIVPVLESSGISETQKIRIFQKISYFNQTVRKHLSVFEIPALQGQELLQAFLATGLRDVPRDFAVRVCQQNILAHSVKEQILGQCRVNTFQGWGEILFDPNFSSDLRKSIASSIRYFDDSESYTRPDHPVEPELVQICFRSLIHQTYGDSSALMLSFAQLFQPELFDLPMPENRTMRPGVSFESELERGTLEICVLRFGFDFYFSEDENSSFNSYQLNRLREGLGLSPIEFFYLYNQLIVGTSPDINTLNALTNDVFEHWEIIKAFVLNDPDRDFSGVIHDLGSFDEREQGPMDFDRFVYIFDEIQSIPGEYKSTLRYRMLPHYFDCATEDVEAKLIDYFTSERSFEDKQQFSYALSNVPLPVVQCLGESEEYTPIVNYLSYRLPNFGYEAVQDIILDSDANPILRRKLIDSTTSIDLDTAVLPDFDRSGFLDISERINPDNNPEAPFVEGEAGFRLMVALGSSNEESAGEAYDTLLESLSEEDQRIMRGVAEFGMFDLFKDVRNFSSIRVAFTDPVLQERAQQLSAISPEYNLCQYAIDDGYHRNEAGSDVHPSSVYRFCADAQAFDRAVALGILAGEYDVGNANIFKYEELQFLGRLDEAGLVQVREILTCCGDDSAAVIPHIQKILEYPLASGNIQLQIFRVHLEQGFDLSEAFPISRDNFLEHLSPNEPLFIFPKDSGLADAVPIPWTSDWFQENLPLRLSYLVPEKIETFYKFGTIGAEGILADEVSPATFQSRYDNTMTLEALSQNNIRDSLLQMGEVFSILLKEQQYSGFDLLADDKSFPVGAVFKAFVEQYKIGNKGRTILCLLFLKVVNERVHQYVAQHGSREGFSGEHQAEFAESIAIPSVLGAMCDELNQYSQLFTLYDEERIPDGLRISVGTEYEVTYSTGRTYRERTGGRGYVNDIRAISRDGGIGQGNDAMYEIANRPTTNPYLLILEWRLLSDLGFLDLNFSNPEHFSNAGYANASTGYHLTFGAEGREGMRTNKASHFVQNILLMADFGGINAGEDIAEVQQFFGVLRPKGYGMESVFSSGSTQGSELRALSIDRAETFERCLISAFNMHIAKNAVDTYMDKKLFSRLDDFKLEDLGDSPESFQLFCEEHELLRPGVKISDPRIWQMMYAFLSLVLQIVELVEDHNHNFWRREALWDQSTAELRLLSSGLSSGSPIRNKAFQYFDLDLEYLMLLSEEVPQVVADEQALFARLESDGKGPIDNQDYSEDKRQLYLWFKKKVLEPLSVLRDNSKELYDTLDFYFPDALTDQHLEQKMRNRLQFEAFLGYPLTEDKRLALDQQVALDRDFLFRPITEKEINTLSFIHNLFLKSPIGAGSDTVNLHSYLSTTLEDGEPRTDEDALTSTSYDSVGRGKSAREGRYCMQGASDEMLIHQTQSAILDFNATMTNILAPAPVDPVVSVSAD